MNPKLDIDNTPWFTAHAIGINFQPHLKVRRSLNARESDEVYAPVREFLDSHPHQVEHQTEVDDPTMDSGKAVDTLYRLIKPT
ncbi:hypothetical protein AWB85_20330 [Mycobacteroides immunogenum]|uniref:Uncharacterized protein n=1 Tax=Mycobacteroides immunogenum TaxID=83262 RepID=A0A179VC30_9MYCO|nr:hypothetical protein [Mycobacteroides immunogenum]OAT69439.1 hypothetical protein AWB85_20330 [Mycobacteroides immunogenum]